METKVGNQESNTNREGGSQAAGSQPVEANPSASQSATHETPGAELPADLAGAYQKVQAEKRELYDRLLRKQAEFENYRKRAQREKEEFLQHANAELVRSLLPALDAFERALKQRDPRVPEAFYQGLELTYRQLLDVLGRAGLTPLEAEGKDFDPHLHQAIETVEAEGVRDHEVVEEVQRGYKFKHRLLRPAMVKVAIRPKRSEGAADTSAGNDGPSPPNRASTADLEARPMGELGGEHQTKES